MAKRVRINNDDKVAIEKGVCDNNIETRQWSQFKIQMGQFKLQMDYFKIQVECFNIHIFKNSNHAKLLANMWHLVHVCSQLDS